MGHVDGVGPLRDDCGDVLESKVAQLGLAVVVEGEFGEEGAVAEGGHGVFEGTVRIERTGNGSIGTTSRGASTRQASVVIVVRLSLLTRRRSLLLRKRTRASRRKRDRSGGIDVAGVVVITRL